MRSTPPGGAPLIPSLPASQGRRVLLLLTGLSLALSASPSFRVQVGSLLFQPVLIPAMLLFLMGASTSFARLPQFARSAMVAFVGVYLAAILVGGFDVGDVFKILMFVLVIVAVGGSIEDGDDARAAALGFVISMGLVGVFALAGGDTGERNFNPLGGVSNANGFSVYALPAVLLAGYFVLESATPFRSRVVFAASGGIAAVTVLTTPNRSGFLGLAIIVVLLLARGRRTREIVGLVVLVSSLYIGFLAFGDTTAIDAEFGRDGGVSDAGVRQSLVEESFSVGLRNPVLGVGVQNVPAAIGQGLYDRGEIRYPYIDAHNVVGDVVAGGGLTLLVSFVVLGWSLWSRPKEWAALGPPDAMERSARGLLRIVLVLFLVRGMFSGDVLTTPGFPFAIAVALGWMVANRPRREESGDESESLEQPRARAHAMMSGAPARDAVSPTSRYSHSRRLVSFDPWSPG